MSDTSYEDTHSQRDTRYVDSIHVLFDAFEVAIFHHVKTNSEWWQNNRERLCSSREGALIYFAIRACTASPEANIDLVGRMLSDHNLLEFYLCYELGLLIKSAFILLDAATQDAVMENILSLDGKNISDESSRFWVLKKKAGFIAPIPCYQRSPEAQEVLDTYERKAGALIQQPDIRSRGGMVRAPFSYEEFLNSGDSGILRLLSHYAGYKSDFEDFLVGGEREVGSQLQEASSRHPMRFLHLLPKYWLDIAERFRGDIMDGVATYLAHRHGNLRANSTWAPVEEADASILVGLIFDELERHQEYWKRNRSAAKALEACSNVIYDAEAAERLIFLALEFKGLREEDPIKGDNVGLISIGINMIKGDIADALMILANNLHERGVEFPKLLAPALCRFASDENPAVRSLILRRLPYMQSRAFDLGWKLFHLVMIDAERLWEIAEPCLYYSYHNHFEVVKPLLARLRDEGKKEDLETWGRISALAAMGRQIDFSTLLEELKVLDKTEAWQGAATVWTNCENIQQHREQCFLGLDEGLNSGAAHAEAVAEQMGQLFHDKSALISVPISLIQRCFDLFKSDKNNEKKHRRLFGFHEWLNATAQHDPELALTAAEIYLTYALHCRPYLYDHKGRLTQLMTRLFAEAEEREESDYGAMLQRVVVVQDTLLSLGVNGVADWLKAAERP